MSTRRALAFSFIERYSALIVSVASTMVIARLLTPAEIGVYSVVMVLLGFVATMRDLGAGQYMVQHKTLGADSLRAIWTVQLGLGLLFALLVVATAAAVAQYYGDARMREIMYVLALNFAVTPFLAFPNAWLVREMRFGTLTGVRLVGALTHAGVAVGLAVQGWGPISLAWANLATTIAGVVVIRLISDAPMPGKLGLHGIRSVISFGGRLTAASFIDTVRSGSPEILLGKIQGLTSAGLFSRSQGLVSLFQQLVLNAVGAVALPYFARESREGRPLGPSFVLSVELITGLGWPFFGGLALLAYPGMRILYGDQWDAAVEPTRWLAIAAAISLPALICSAPMIAVNALNDLLKASALSMGLSLVAVAAGAQYDLTVLAQLLAVAALFSSAYWLWLAKSRLKFEWPQFALATLRSAKLTVVTLVAPILTVFFLGWNPDNVWLACLVAIPCAVLGFLFAARLLQHALWAEIQRFVQAQRQRFK